MGLSTDTGTRHRTISWLRRPPRVSDPGHTVLRRGLRVAVLVPLTFFVFEIVLGLSASALPAAFATFTILAFANLGGPVGDRFKANLALGALGVSLVAVGSLVSNLAWLAVASTFVVTFAISYASVLRGYFAASSVAALVPWVYAATSPHDLDVMPQRCLGWAVGAVVASVGSIVLWPSHPRSELRGRLATTIDAAAELVTQMSLDPTGPTVRLAWEQVAEAMDATHSAYDGRLVRPGVGTSRDRNLMLAFDQLSRLKTALHSWVEAPPPVEVRACDLELARILSRTLAECAESLRRGYGVIGVTALNDARELQQEQLVHWASQPERADDPSIFRSELEGSFQVRVAAMTGQILAVYVKGALDTRDPTIGRGAADADSSRVSFGGETVLDPSRNAPVRQLLASQWHLRSPWMRTALRTATALAITVLVVQLTGAQFGFWVSLGALVALKLDASGTQRTASMVLVGTVVGFIIASGLILAVGENVWIYWVLLPIVAFLAAYTPGAVSLAVGQGSFTVFLLTLFGILHPATLSTGVIRLVDVALGLVISLMVSALAWPRGIAPTVRRTLHRAALASGDFLVASYARLVEGPIAQTSLNEAESGAREALTVANETFDLALNQGGPHQTERIPVWTTFLNCTSQIAFAASVVSVLERVSPLPIGSASGDAMLALAHHVKADVARSSDALGRGQIPDIVEGRTTTESLARLRHLVDEDLQVMWQRSTGPETGLVAMILVFAAAWLAQCLWLANRVRERVTETVAAADAAAQVQSPT